MPTDWEDHYRRGETPWEKGAPSPGLMDDLAVHPVRGRVLVPGCGFGRVRAMREDLFAVTLSLPCPRPR